MRCVGGGGAGGGSIKEALSSCDPPNGPEDHCNGLCAKDGGYLCGCGAFDVDDVAAPAAAVVAADCGGAGPRAIDRNPEEDEEEEKEEDGGGRGERG